MIENFIGDVLNDKVDENYNIWDNDKTTLEMIQGHQSIQTLVILLMNRMKKSSKVLISSHLN